MLEKALNLFLKSENIHEPEDVTSVLFAKQPFVGSQYLSGEQ